MDLEERRLAEALRRATDTELPPTPPVSDDVARGRRALRRRRLTASMAAACGVVVAVATFAGAGMFGADSSDADDDRAAGASADGQGRDASDGGPEKGPGTEAEPVVATVMPKYRPEEGIMPGRRNTCEVEGDVELLGVLEYPTSGAELLRHRIDGEDTYLRCDVRQVDPERTALPVGVGTTRITGTHPNTVLTDPAELRSFIAFTVDVFVEGTLVVAGSGGLPQNVERLIFDMPDGEVVEAIVADQRWLLWYATEELTRKDVTELRVRMVDPDGVVLFDESIARGHGAEPEAPPEQEESGGESGATVLDSASFTDVVLEHIDSPSYQATGRTAGAGLELSWGTWAEKRGGGQSAEGTVAVGVFTGAEANGDWIGRGPDGPCALLPFKSSHEGVFWETCRSEEIPGMGTLFTAERDDSAAIALRTPNGELISVAQSTTYFERSADTDLESVPGFPDRLSELPLSAEQMRAIVTDPRMLENAGSGG